MDGYIYRSEMEGLHPDSISYNDSSHPLVSSHVKHKELEYQQFRFKVRPGDGQVETIQQIEHSDSDSSLPPYPDHVTVPEHLIGAGDHMTVPEHMIGQIVRPGVHVFRPARHMDDNIYELPP